MSAKTSAFTNLSVDISLPEGFSERISDSVCGGIADLLPVVFSYVANHVIACSSLETTGLAEHPVVARWVWPQNLDAEIAAALRALRNDIQKIAFAHTNSSSVATGDESVGEVATPSRAKSLGDAGEGWK
ncbi:hypothetical protein [Acetobacter sp. UBA5411]|uniref:hypothetical protein n=1 Tax=Acetobacter sp. UBA5411 TaxID=1945905 RepID=UPI0025BACF03|nr:hypothetical protein [Acetobacter sp. UBA5411]